MNTLLNSGGEADFTSDLFWDRVHVLLDWSVTPLQYGDHRIYAVASILRDCKEKLDEQLALRDPSCPRGDVLFQMRLFEWLDTSKIVGELENRRTVAPLLGQLIRLGLFSYTVYVQRLIARGDVGLGPQPVGLLDRVSDVFLTRGHRVILDTITSSRGHISIVPLFPLPKKGAHCCLALAPARRGKIEMRGKFGRRSAPFSPKCLEGRRTVQEIMFQTSARRARLSFRQRVTNRSRC